MRTAVRLRDVSSARADIPNQMWERPRSEQLPSRTMASAGGGWVKYLGKRIEVCDYQPSNLKPALCSTGDAGHTQRR